jgi:hypothetical protein
MAKVVSLSNAELDRLRAVPNNEFYSAPDKHHDVLEVAVVRQVVDEIICRCIELEETQMLPECVGTELADKQMMQRVLKEAAQNPLWKRFAEDYTHSFGVITCHKFYRKGEGREDFERVLQVSVDVLCGKITRQQGLKALRAPRS